MPEIAEVFHVSHVVEDEGSEVPRRSEAPRHRSPGSRHRRTKRYLRTADAQGLSLASARLPGMAFGQQSGLPATMTQVRDLLALLQEAGHSDFRDARGPMGFTQRQGAGKFTRDEADAFIEQLQAAETTPEVTTSGPAVRSARLSTAEQGLRRMRAEDLAAELQRRGWVVMEP